MRVIKITFLEIVNILRSKKLYIVSAAIAFLLCLDVIEVIDGNGDVVSVLEFAGNLTWLGYLIMALAILPFGYMYCDECNEHYNRTMLSRCTSLEYAISRIMSSFAGGFLCVAMGYVIWMIVESLFYPFMAEGGYAYHDSYLLSRGKIFAWTAVKILAISMRDGFYVAVAVLVSTVVPNKYLIMAIPMMLYRIIIEGTYFIIDLPSWIDPYLQYMPSYIGANGQYGFRLAYSALYTFVCLMFFAVIADYFIRKKI